jgi:hypothetical protein
MAESLRLNSRMGLDADGNPIRESVANWPLPGKGWRGFAEAGQRQLLVRWAEMLADDRPLRASRRRSTIGDAAAA